MSFALPTARDHFCDIIVYGFCVPARLRSFTPLAFSQRWWASSKASSDNVFAIAALADRLALEILLENYRSFLRFLERRVGSREDAEDILQDAFTRNLAKVEDVSEGNSDQM